MTSERSITSHISRLKSGNDDAANELWRRYFDKLVRLAKNQLGNRITRVHDEEDVALSSFRCLCEGAQRGVFEELTDREDLWKLFVKITSRKSIDTKRRAASQKRGGGKVRGESVFETIDQNGSNFDIADAAIDELSPEDAICLVEEHQRLIDLLEDESLKTVALLKMEGFTNKEIASRLDRTTRSVERKLNSIREIWSNELNGV